MLTIFALPKAFKGKFAIHQRNAIGSWTLLRPACEIILFGDDEGTKEIAQEFGIRHIPTVRRNRFGVPLVNDLFDKAQTESKHRFLCYVNSDIILLSDFLQALQAVLGWRRKFMLTGNRLELEVNQPLRFGAGWETPFREYALGRGRWNPIGGIDYLVFPRGLFGKIPPFGIGRCFWDNWLIYKARYRRAPVIDATEVVLAVHQIHDYSHVPGGIQGILQGPEGKRNLELAEKYGALFELQDADWLLTKNGLVRVDSPERLARAKRMWPHLHPWRHGLRLAVPKFFTKPWGIPAAAGRRLRMLGEYLRTFFWQTEQD